MFHPIKTLSARLIIKVESEMKKKALSILLAIALCLALLSVTALAASDTGSYVFDISKGGITIVDGTDTGTVKVTYGSNSVDNIDPSQVITVTGEYTGTSDWERDNNLVVKTSTPVTIKASKSDHQ